MPETILIVDNDPTHLRATEYAIQHKLGYRAATALSAEEAVHWIASNQQPQPDLILLDLIAPGTGGAKAIADIKSHKPGLPLVVITPYGEEDQAAQAIRAGADDFLTRPMVLERLRLTMQNSLKIRRIHNTLSRIELKNSGHVNFTNVIGQSSLLKDAVAVAQKAAANKMPVWIEGEEGTGKELLARSLHGSSDRAGKPFINIDCERLPEDTAEALLFGQEKTPGTLHFALGKIREAQGGTLYFHEIGALKPELQQRLLELMHTGMYSAAGSETKLQADVRIIASSRKKSEQLLQHSQFSHNLYRHFSSAVIAMPPLRARRTDIPLLARHFIATHSACENKFVYGLTEQAAQELAGHAWPGNIRQLSHVLWRMVMLCERDLIDVADVRQWMKAPTLHYPEGAEAPIAGTIPTLVDMQGRIRKLKSIEEDVIRFALRHSNGCMTRAARSLGIGRSTLYRRVNELSLDGYISRANQTTRPMMKVSSIERS